MEGTSLSTLPAFGGSLVKGTSEGGGRQRFGDAICRQLHVAAKKHNLV